MAAKRGIEPKTAAEALAIRAERIDRMLVSIRKHVEETLTKHRETTDWGHVGPLSHVAVKLSEVDAFLRGGSEEEDPEAA